jgi:hypothetical protein
MRGELRSGPEESGRILEISIREIKREVSHMVDSHIQSRFKTTPAVCL